MKTLLRLRHLLPSIDSKLANPSLPVDVSKYALNELDMLDFQAESNINHSEEESKDDGKSIDSGKTNSVTFAESSLAK